MYILALDKRPHVSFLINQLYFDDKQLSRGVV